MTVASPAARKHRVRLLIPTADIVHVISDYLTGAEISSRRLRYINTELSRVNWTTAICRRRWRNLPARPIDVIMQIAANQGVGLVHLSSWCVQRSVRYSATRKAALSTLAQLDKYQSDSNKSVTVRSIVLSDCSRHGDQAKRTIWIS